MKTPWRNNEELKRFWALARRYGGHDFVYDTIYLRYGAEKLHEIARHQFLELLEHMEKNSSRFTVHGSQLTDNREPITDNRQPAVCGCGTHHGAASCGQYRKILWLMRQLGWDEIRLNAYIKKYAHIDSIRFFTAAKARGIITGMEKMYCEASRRGAGAQSETKREAGSFLSVSASQREKTTER